MSLEGIDNGVIQEAASGLVDASLDLTECTLTEMPQFIGTTAGHQVGTQGVSHGRG